MIQMEHEDIERIRDRLRKMSDLELRQYGRAAGDLSNPKEELWPTESLIPGSIGRGEGGMAQTAS